MEKDSNVPRQRPTLLRICVKRFGRFPHTLMVDGGKEFHSEYFDSLVARYDGIKKTRPGAKPRFGSVIERLFGTTNTEFVYNWLFLGLSELPCLTKGQRGPQG